jgi:hypothetical protein
MAADLSPRRRLAFSGTWYDGDPVRLGRQVDAWLNENGPARPGVRAIVSPHAGLRYSGRIAARAYAALGPTPRAAVVLVGPSHYVAFPGCSILARGAVDAPWGTHPIAEPLADAIAAATPVVSKRGEEIHAREHSLELQLPLLSRLHPGIPLVWILMGQQSRQVAYALGDAIARAVGDRDVALVASSDLSHYHDATTARAMDGRVLAALDTRSADALMRVLESDPHHACGGGPMVAVLHAASQLGSSEGGVVAYGDSGDVTGDKSSVVGYAAAVFGGRR